MDSFVSVRAGMDGAGVLIVGVHSVKRDNVRWGGLPWGDYYFETWDKLGMHIFSFW